LFVYDQNGTLALTFLEFVNEKQKRYIKTLLYILLMLLTLYC